jgi:sterol desaturase/sphingolipid hydroxylase (fatty acid hydroxylase superfamily)
MSSARGPVAIHWPHLVLLAGLPAWYVATSGWPPALRLSGWLAVVFALLAAAEWRRPFRRDWQPDARALRRDGSVFALNALLDAVLGAALAWIALAWFEGRSALPFWGQLLLGIGLGELASYALHRASHAEGWLWRVHLLHHRPEQLNVANALTAHPVNAAYDKLARLLPLLVLGWSDAAILAITLFTLTQNLVVHANVAGTIGPLNLVVGSAELHRLHHSTREDDAGNFGTTVPWWDLLFGTFRWRRAPVQVGVFEPGRYPGEFELGSLLCWPWRRGARRVAPS